MAEMRPSRYPLVSVQTALDTIMAHVTPLGCERVWLGDALGRVLARTLTAPVDVPAAPISGVDGYAVVAAAGGAPRRVVGELTAGGQGSRPLGPDEAARIMTGAALPAGTDAVVMVEDTAEAAGVVTITATPRVGDNVRPRAIDLKAGQTVLQPGTQLRSPEIGLLSSLGVLEVDVYRRPVVAVLATGDEVVDPWREPAPGQVRDSNRPAVLAAIAEAGGIPVSLGLARDDEALQTAMIRGGFERADVVITSGGVSVGSRDLIKPILESLGQIHVGRVAVKPGKPLTFATVGSKLFFGLPGFPVSTLVTFEVFARHALLRMQGLAATRRPRVEVVLSEPVRPSPDRTEYQRAIVCYQDGALRAVTTGVQVSSRLMSLVGANALIVIEPGTSLLPAGAKVPAFLTGELVDVPA